MMAVETEAGERQPDSPCQDDPLARRFTGFPVPQGMFYPQRHPQWVLREYGLPPRPDARHHPEMRRAWDRVFGAGLMLQRFVFEEALVDAAQYRPQLRISPAQSVSETRIETSTNWSGAYITANRDRRFVQIWGCWTVPGNLQLPPPEQQGPPNVDYVCSNWIGLDGQRLYLDSSLPQIGTACTLKGQTTVPQAWVQWWARSSSNVKPVPLGLAVDINDLISCVLTVQDPQTVILVMVNLTQGTGMAVQAMAPPVTLPNGEQVTPQIAGATAEWIVERPAIPSQQPNPAPYNFPDYGTSGFDLCLAIEGSEMDAFALFDGVPQQLTAARRIRMFDVLDGPARTRFISMPRELTPDAVTLRYGGF